jgi:hypothetical protein
MALNLSYYAAMLKEFYGSALQETFNNEVLLKKWLETSSKSWDGLRVTFPVHSGRNGGVGARAESALLPTAGQQSATTVYITAAYIYGRIDLTGQVMAAGGKNAFAEALSTEMEGVKTDLVRDVGRQVYNEGQGILGESANTASASQIFLRNSFRAPGYHGARYIDVGMPIDGGSNTTFAATYEGFCGQSGSNDVTVVTIAANSGTTYDTIEITGSVATTNISDSKAFVFRAGAGSVGIEMKGLRAIVDDQTASNNYGCTGGYFNNDTIFNVDRGSVKGWNSYVDANSGVERVLDSYLLQKAMSRTKRNSGKEVDIMFAEYDTVDAFWDSVAGDRRFTSKMFDAGVDTLTYNGKTFVKDLLAPYNELFGLYKPALKWYVLKDLAFADDDGSTLKQVANYDRFEAFLRMYAQLAPGEEAAPNSCFVVRVIKTRL